MKKFVIALIVTIGLLATTSCRDKDDTGGQPSQAPSSSATATPSEDMGGTEESPEPSSPGTQESDKADPVKDAQWIAENCHFNDPLPAQCPDGMTPTPADDYWKIKPSPTQDVMAEQIYQVFQAAGLPVDNKRGDVDPDCKDQFGQYWCESVVLTDQVSIYVPRDQQLLTRKVTSPECVNEAGVKSCWTMNSYVLQYAPSVSQAQQQRYQAELYKQQPPVGPRG